MRIRIVKYRVSEDEKRTIESAAAIKRQTISEYARGAALAAAALRLLERHAGLEHIPVELWSER